MHRFDQRVQNFEDKLTEGLTSDSFNLLSSVYVGWRITDAKAFFPKFAGSAEPIAEAEKALGEAAITVNKNAIPFDTNPPMRPSGIRVGTPAMTTRGMKEEEMRQIGRWIAEALNNRTDAAVLGKIRKQVLALAEEFPLYAERRARAQAEVRA